MLLVGGVCDCWRRRGSVRYKFRQSDSVKFVDVRFMGQNDFRGLVLGYSIGGKFEGIAGKRLDGTRCSWGFRIS